MEPQLHSDVGSPPRPPAGSCGARGKYAKSRHTLELNQRLVRDLARHLHQHPCSGEEVGKLLGASPKSLGAIREELAHIKAWRSDPFTTDRLLRFFEIFGADPFAGFAAPQVRLAS